MSNEQLFTARVDIRDTIYDDLLQHYRDYCGEGEHPVPVMTFLTSASAALNKLLDLIGDEMDEMNGLSDLERKLLNGMN